MSCLFISIGKLLSLPHETIRQDICDFMERNMELGRDGVPWRQWIQWESPSMTAEVYISNMRSTSQWGGAMEISVATQVYKVDVTVVAASDHRVLAEFVSREGEPSSWLLIVSWTGSHYTPVSIVHRPSQ